jgi:hypothetical protein
LNFLSIFSLLLMMSFKEALKFSYFSFSFVTAVTSTTVPLKRRGKREGEEENGFVIMREFSCQRSSLNGRKRESVCVCVCVCVDADFENRRYFFVFFRPIIFSHVVFDLLPDIGTRGSSLRLFIRI